MTLGFGGFEDPAVIPSMYVCSMATRVAKRKRNT